MTLLMFYISETNRNVTNAQRKTFL